MLPVESTAVCSFPVYCNGYSIPDCIGGAQNRLCNCSAELDQQLLWKTVFPHFSQEVLLRMEMLVTHFWSWEMVVPRKVSTVDTGLSDIHCHLYRLESVQLLVVLTAPVY